MRTRPDRPWSPILYRPPPPSVLPRARRTARRTGRRSPLHRPRRAGPDACPPSRPAARLLACLLPVLLLGAGWAALPAVGHAAPDRDYLLGMPWEREVVDGIAEQDRDRRRNKPLDALVREWGRRARRAATVPNMYLLARAYGLRFAEGRDLAAAAQGEEERGRLERAAHADLGSALSAYGDVLQAEPRCYFALHDMAFLELRRADRQRRQAYDHLVQALRINDRYVDARRKLILLFLEGDQQREAVPQLEVLLRQVPDDSVARLQLVAGLVRLERHAEAEEHLRLLLGRQPDHPAYLDVLAQIQVATGRFEEGLNTYRALARANPSMGQPFLGIFRSLEKYRSQFPDQPPRFDDYLFALRGLLRLETDPERRARLEGDIRAMEEQQLRPPVAEGPAGEPTTEQVLALLDSAPDEDNRARAIYWLLTRGPAPTPEAMRQIARRLGPAVEPAAGVRTLAVRALAEVGGTGSVPLVRLALSDPEPRVRGACVDALVVVALRDRAIRRPMVVLLHLYTQDVDKEVRASARLGVLQLAAHALELPEEADEAAHRAAYDAWIASPAGEVALARGLDEFDALRDRYAEDVLTRYFEAPAGIVVKAAYDALCRFAGSGAAAGGRGAWLERRPRLGHEAFRADALEATRATLLAWRGNRP